MQGSPYSEAVYCEWEQLAFPKGKLAGRDKKRRWDALFQRNFSQGAWTVNVYDAGLIASMGVSIALGEKRWSDAALLSSLFLKHPQAEIDPVSVDHHVLRLGCSTILAGDVDAGLEVLLKPLERGEVTRAYVPDLRNLLHGGLLDELGLEDLPDHRISHLVSVILLGFPNKKRASKAALKATANRELQDLLALTWK